MRAVHELILRRRELTTRVERAVGAKLIDHRERHPTDTGSDPEWQWRFDERGVMISHASDDRILLVELDHAAASDQRDWFTLAGLQLFAAHSVLPWRQFPRLAHRSFPASAVAGIARSLIARGELDLIGNDRYVVTARTRHPYEPVVLSAPPAITEYCRPHDPIVALPAAGVDRLLVETGAGGSGTGAAATTTDRDPGVDPDSARTPGA